MTTLSKKGSPFFVSDDTQKRMAVVSPTEKGRYPHTPEHRFSLGRRRYGKSSVCFNNGRKYAASPSASSLVALELGCASHFESIK